MQLTLNHDKYMQKHTRDFSPKFPSTVQLEIYSTSKEKYIYYLEAVVNVMKEICDFSKHRYT